MGGLERAALWASILAGVIVWNAVYDLRVESGTLDYLKAQDSYSRGVGPPTSIDGVMKPAIGAAIRLATLCASVASGGGLLATWALGRRRRLRQRQASPTDP